jgi:hypothetical protein
MAACLVRSFLQAKVVQLVIRKPNQRSVCATPVLPPDASADQVPGQGEELCPPRQYGSRQGSVQGMSAEIRDGHSRVLVDDGGNEGLIGPASIRPDRCDAFIHQVIHAEAIALSGARA